MVSEQAAAFGRYLLKTKPNTRVIALYEKAITYDKGEPDAGDTKLLAFIGKHPGAISFIDAALALIKPNSEVRRRLYVMFSILEASPDYHHLFLPQKHSGWYIFALAGATTRGICRAICGIVLVKVVVK